jgi:4-hydroxythreonine-4-phosphate dehydrogenase
MQEAVERWAPALSCSIEDPQAILTRRSWGPSSGQLTLVDPMPTAREDEKRLPEAAAIRLAVEGCLSGNFEALVTAPISKESMYARGFPFPGHTEFLGHLTGVPRSIMGFSAPGLRVSLATVHEPLTRVPGLVTEACLEQTIRISYHALQTQFAIAQPRLAVCGLNPHAGENGHLGREELEVVSPVIARLQQEGLRVKGPYPADTVFGRALRGEFDLVVALYHDQGLIPIKLLSFGESVNVTFGLPIVRTSVDHGVAFDIAGKGLADCSSMKAAIRLALEIVERRRGPT